MAPDNIEFSQNGFIEYRPGDLNVILAAPHGGSLLPSYIPNRDAGALVDGKWVYRHNLEKDYTNCQVRNKKDVYTRELTLLLSNELVKVTGKTPHVIINHLHRLKMDGNSEKDRATFGIASAESAWQEFHNFIDKAKKSIGGRGLYLDLHGHGHPEKFIELGYTIPAENLNNGLITCDTTSIKNLAKVNKLTSPDAFIDLITGTNSFGGMLEEKGYNSVPSPSIPCPNDCLYYSGGYNTDTHGSRHSGVIDAIQIESPRYLRNIESAPQYAADLAEVIVKYLQLYYR